jgi:hypothetical protein
MNVSKEIWKEEEKIDTSQFEPKPMSIDELTGILGLTIIKDDVNKVLIFLCMLTAYTEDSQFNISLNAPSSTGKSYPALEIDTLFPKTDVIELLYASPTAFFHDQMIWNADKKVWIVNLSRKILVFLDLPKTGLYQRLRPLFSHDRKELLSKITDKSDKKGTRTKNTLILGYPSVVFCSAGLKLDEQEGTRFLLLSPEMDEEKIRESIRLKISKEADPQTYKELIENNPARQLLKKRLEAIKAEKIINIHLHDRGKIEKMFLERNLFLLPRHMRDVGRVISIVKALALLNVWFRKREDLDILTSDEDVREAFRLWDAISESQELGLPPYLLSIYKEIFVPLWKEKNGPITKNEILSRHRKALKRNLPEGKLRKEIIPMFQDIGLLIEEPDSDDKRRMLFYKGSEVKINGANGRG